MNTCSWTGKAHAPPATCSTPGVLWVLPFLAMTLKKSRESSDRWVATASRGGLYGINVTLYENM